jgi:tRNA threonylcarbamoyladenosine biosynthesis protein TsaE
MKILVKDKKGLPAAVRKLLRYAGNRRIFAFYGHLGAGKTTIIKHLCEALGSRDLVCSPSFTLVNEYKTDSGENIYHIDLFRIKSLSEAFDFGIEEYLTGDSYCFMEWPEKAEEILPSGTVNVRITVDNDDQRILSIS